MSVLVILLIDYSELFQHNYAEECKKKKRKSKNTNFLICMFVFLFRIDVMTSTVIDGIKRSNVCGDGYRIEGAVLRSYPYSPSQTYLPYENCLMTFQSRRTMNSILIRILVLDLNDISSGKKCFDTLHFYNSVRINLRNRLV